MMELSKQWRIQKTQSSQHENPDWMKTTHPSPPLLASVPNTVAQLLLDSHPQPLESLSDLDEYDWWYSTDFDLPETHANQHELVFDGLATLADIWLNGVLILNARNMFLQYRVDVSERLQEKNQLVICFRSLANALKEKKSRPKWKTRLVEQQNLRWFRTSLLGYISGWASSAKPIGPWKGIRLESAETVKLNDLSLQPWANQADGHIKIAADFSCYQSQPCEIIFEINNKKHVLFSGITQDKQIRINEKIVLPQIQTWNPHTHGNSKLYQYSLSIQFDGKEQVLQNGQLGFRDVKLNRNDHLFQLQINGQSIFARGAVWTVNDLISLTGTTDDLRLALTLARDAGMNMLRISGTMLYEQDEFYNLCDELGIMIWQDFMFSNMDYPVTDEAFHENITREVTYQLKRLSAHPCIVIYCGNNEVEQQAAMMGIPEEYWRNKWFGAELPELVHQLHENSVYVPSTPSEGTLPFYTSEGVTHYYGVGAYRRDIQDTRRADVKFASECLGFANVPEDKTIIKLLGDLDLASNQPLWKSGVPKDNGSDWDFEDVRDHYLRELFDADPDELKNTDTARYLLLARIASGEMMNQVFSEWRSSNSNCGGGLVWFYKDLLPGAGWGVLDSDNTPKAAYYYLKRTLQPVSLVITDEGLQGLHLHAINESPRPFTGLLEFRMLQNENVTVARAAKEISIAPHSSITIHAEELLGGFYDTAYAYRFGPPKHDVACGSLKNSAGEIICQQFHFPLKKTFPHIQAEIEAAAWWKDDGYQLSILSDRFLHAVQIKCEGFLPDDNYFHLMPGEPKLVKLKPASHASEIPQIFMRAANTREFIKILIRD